MDIETVVADATETVSENTHNTKTVLITVAATTAALIGARLVARRVARKLVTEVPAFVVTETTETPETVNA
jgi:hypothetical protein